MYLDIKQIKALQARAIAARVDSSIIEPIMRDIKSAAAEGRESIKLEYEKYNIDDSSRNYIKHWARICGFNTASYSDCIFINW